MAEERYVLDMELVPHSIVDLYTGDTYPISDEGILETAVSLLNGLNGEIQSKLIVIKGYQERLDRLQERNNRQANTIAEQGQIIDNYIDIKSKLDGKIQEYATKSEEYELEACPCHARITAHKKDALEEFKEEVYKV